MRSGKLGWGVVSCIIAALVAAPSFADTEGAVRDVLKTMSGPNLIENPRVSTTPEGYVRFMAAPAGNAFQPSRSAKAAGNPEAIAKEFLKEHSEAFGIKPGVDFSTDRVKSTNARTYVRLNQTYKGVQVFGAQALLQMKPGGAVVSTLSDIMRDAPRVYSGAVSTSPTLNKTEAKLAAVATLEDANSGRVFEAREPELFIYMPYVLGASGQAKLVYSVETGSIDADAPIAEQILIDAHTGGDVLRIPMIKHAKDREIYDAENLDFVELGILKRNEGQAASGITDVDDAYDFYGDTYDFYNNRHNRDSIDNDGMTMRATVRYCAGICPHFNASWSSFQDRMFFGEGFVVDDVVGHELTHGVTDYESNLIYFMESGALNESFSDVWGEFIDLTNGKGVDTPEVRWLIGEEIPAPIGTIRNMADPHQFQNADTYFGLYWIFDPNFDGGGVHYNSGVSNKLAYLLTDGDEFKGFTIEPMGINTVADLYYECQTHLLLDSSDYPDFGQQMLTAASNLGLSQVERENVEAALFATQILKPALDPLRAFRATGRSGDNRLAITWKNPSDGDFTGVDIVRNTTRFPNSNSDGTVIATITNGIDESFIDTPGGAVGSDVYYGIFPRAGSFPLNLPLYTRGTIGVDVDFLTEAFTNGTDLAFKQITMVPTGAVPITGPATQRPEVYFNYTTYTAHASVSSKIAPNFDGTLPVAKEDYLSLALEDDGNLQFDTQIPIPFFGRLINNWLLSGNGFLAEATAQYLTEDVNATTSLESHFKIPRIAFLYSDLDPRSGGEVWARFLDDRVAITFENVPSYDSNNTGQPGQSFANTVQCELFYGGQIRFTYLSLTADRAIVGLSDGNGVPLNVNQVLAGQNPNAFESDLAGLPESVDLELQPVATQFIESGAILEFTAVANSTVGAPTFSKIDPPAEFGIEPMTGAELDPVTGEFVWNTEGLPDGPYGVIMCASAGDASSCQIVSAIIVTSSVKPTVENVSIAPTAPRDSDNLIADYDYKHPSLPQGPSVIYWFKNDAIVPAYTNHTLLPHEITTVGDKWYFQILPATVQVGSYVLQPIYLYGNPELSKTVTIESDVKVDTNGDGKVNSVDLQLVVGGLLGTSGPGIDPDVNGDGSEDAADVQTTINYILEKR